MDAVGSVAYEWRKRFNATVRFMIRRETVMLVTVS